MGSTSDTNQEPGECATLQRERLAASGSNASRGTTAVVNQDDEKMDLFGDLGLVSTATEERLSPKTSHAHLVGDEEQACREPSHRITGSRLASKQADFAGSNGRQARASR